MNKGNAIFLPANFILTSKKGSTNICSKIDINTRCILTRADIQQGVNVELEYKKRTSNPSTIPRMKKITDNTIWMIEMTFKSRLLYAISR